jgi:hypothetical protein
MPRELVVGVGVALSSKGCLPTARTFHIVLLAKRKREPDIQRCQITRARSADGLGHGCEVLRVKADGNHLSRQPCPLRIPVSSRSKQRDEHVRRGDREYTGEKSS